MVWQAHNTRIATWPILECNIALKLRIYFKIIYKIISMYYLYAQQNTRRHWNLENNLKLHILCSKLINKIKRWLPVPYYYTHTHIAIAGFRLISAPMKGFPSSICLITSTDISPVNTVTNHILNSSLTFPGMLIKSTSDKLFLKKFNNAVFSKQRKCYLLIINVLFQAFIYAASSFTFHVLFQSKN